MITFSFVHVGLDIPTSLIFPRRCESISSLTCQGVMMVSSRPQLDAGEQAEMKQAGSNCNTEVK